MYFSEWIKKCKISKIRIFLSLILMLFAYVLHITKIRGLELFITILPAWFLFEISNLLVVYDNPIPLAKYSFPIYVMHQLILEPIQYLMGITENSSDFIVLAGYYSSVAMTLIIIICFVKILRKYFPKFGELLFGRGRI